MGILSYAFEKKSLDEFFYGNDIYSSADTVLLPLDALSDGDSADEDGKEFKM